MKTNFRSFENGRFTLVYCTLNSTKDNIRIYHECEGRIEKSVPRVTVWHHEACRVMTNVDPEGYIFLSYPHTNNGLFSLLITVFFNFEISYRSP